MKAEKAAQIMKRIGRFEMAQANIKAQAKAEVAAVNAQCESMVKDEQRKIDYLKDIVLAPLEAFVRAQLSGKNDGKTYKTLWGNVSFPKDRDIFKVEDKTAALEWGKVNLAELVEVRSSVEEVLPAKALEAHFKETGEVPTGCSFTVGVERLKLTAAAKAEVKS